VNVEEVLKKKAQHRSGCTLLPMGDNLFRVNEDRNPNARSVMVVAKPRNGKRISRIRLTSSTIPSTWLEYKFTDPDEKVIFLLLNIYLFIQHRIA
jgi:hypothetical protein